MLIQIKETLSRHLVNLPGWRTRRKIVVFESDDWGSVRCPDRDAYKHYQQQFGAYIESPYLKYDTLASEEDLNLLFDLLSRHKDGKGNHPIFTFNVVTANPDFGQIQAADYKKYIYEPFTATLARYSCHANAFSFWKKAMEEKLMHPQFHGREHVNVPVWLAMLQNQEQNTIRAFECGTWSVPRAMVKWKVNLQASLDYEGEQPMEYQLGYLTEGLRLFEEIFGFKPETMIANNFVMDTNLHPCLLENGIRCLQGMKYQIMPYKDAGKHKYLRRHLGRKDEYGMNFTIRNCSFEPSLTMPNVDDVGQCLDQIRIAFLWGKPTVITSHRLNYIGHLSKENRDGNLAKLDILLEQINAKWPEVEYMNSSELLRLCEQ